MYTRIKNDLGEGLSRAKWFANLLSERLRIELTIVRLLSGSEELKRKRNILLQKVGEETYRMRKDEANAHPSQEMLDAIKEIEALESQITEILDKVSEISRFTA